MTKAHIDLSEISKRLAKTEPFDDIDGLLHGEMTKRSRDGELRNLHFIPPTGQYAGRFYLGGKVRYFAYVKADRLGDLARFMDVVFSQLRCFRQRLKHGELNDAQLNFTVTQTEADTVYFATQRPDVWAIITDIRKAVSNAMKDIPESNVKESNRSNMEKYQSMIYTSRTLTEQGFTELRKQIEHLHKKVDQLLSRLAPIDLTPRAPVYITNPAQTELPTQPFKHGELICESNYKTPTC